MGSQSYTTRALQDTLNPKWNFNCQFFIKDLYQDVLCLTMFDRDQFSPDGKCNLAQRPNGIPGVLGSGVCTQGPKLCSYPMTTTGNDTGHGSFGRGWVFGEGVASNTDTCAYTREALVSTGWWDIVSSVDSPSCHMHLSTSVPKVPEQMSHSRRV